MCAVCPRLWDPVWRHFPDGFSTKPVDSVKSSFTEGAKEMIILRNKRNAGRCVSPIQVSNQYILNVRIKHIRSAAKSIAVYLRNFFLLCGDSLDRTELVAPLFLLRLYRFFSFLY